MVRLGAGIRLVGLLFGRHDRSCILLTAEMGVRGASAYISLVSRASSIRKAVQAAELCGQCAGAWLHRCSTLQSNQTADLNG